MADRVAGGSFDEPAAAVMDPGDEPQFGGAVEADGDGDAGGGAVQRSLAGGVRDLACGQGQRQGERALFQALFPEFPEALRLPVQVGGGQNFIRRYGSWKRW